MIDIDKPFKFLIKDTTIPVYTCEPCGGMYVVQNTKNPFTHEFSYVELLTHLKSGNWVPVEESATTQVKGAAMTKAHIHAGKMIQYGHDALTTEEPWKLWQYLSLGSGEWETAKRNLAWYPHTEYRRKPEPQRTIRIGEYDVPEPMREAPKDGTVYYLATASCKRGATGFTWRDASYDNQWLSSGLIHATEDAAILHAKALTSLSAPRG